MQSISQLPEIRALDCPPNLFRIPDQIDVPVTDRIKRLIDTAAFRRLANIPQLGLVSMVYPGATHSRFEHSLGVYRNTLLFIRQLASAAELDSVVSPVDCEALLVAALLHDVGHWPYCHPIEDIGLVDIPRHETVATEFILNSEIADLLEDDWQLSPQRIVDLLSSKSDDDSANDRILKSILSGPIDVDKMDYLYRDSLHAGVPYGKNFDAPRLISSLRLNRTGDGIAISSKGKTAAELMVFARYVMFSEVYWHHAVRSATAMFQRAFYYWFVDNRDSDHEWRHASNSDWATRFLDVSASAELRELADGLFGPRRLLYKRRANFSCKEYEAIYRKIAQKPFDWLLLASNRLADLTASEIGQQVKPHEVLVDAPPVGLEVQFDVDVQDHRSGNYRRLGEISPVVNTLAHQQFDDFVKQVRVFVHPRLAQSTRTIDFQRLLEMAIED